jgi:hypothetical protein
LISFSVFSSNANFNFFSYTADTTASAKKKEIIKKKKKEKAVTVSRIEREESMNTQLKMDTITIEFVIIW